MLRKYHEDVDQHNNELMHHSSALSNRAVILEALKQVISPTVASALEISSVCFTPFPASPTH
jgi:hypothetical protein